MRQDAGLARPGAGDDEQWAALVEHRLALLGVEPLEQLFGVRSAHARCRWPSVGAGTRCRGLRPRGHAGGVDEGGMGACVRRGVDVRLVPRVADVEAVEGGVISGQPYVAGPTPPARRTAVAERAAGTTTEVPATRWRWQLQGRRHRRHEGVDGHPGRGTAGMRVEHMTVLSRWCEAPRTGRRYGLAGGMSILCRRSPHRAARGADAASRLGSVRGGGGVRPGWRRPRTATRAAGPHPGRWRGAGRR